MTALLIGDLLGRVWANDEARELYGIEETVVVDPADWAAAFHAYEPASRMPLSLERLPAHRAVLEGRVDDVDVLVAPPGRPERIHRVTAQALEGPLGTVLGVTVASHDVTDAWVPSEVPDDITVPCVCDGWQVTGPTTTPPLWFAEALDEHMNECVVLTATRMTVLATP